MYSFTAIVDIQSETYLFNELHFNDIITSIAEVVQPVLPNVGKIAIRIIATDNKNNGLGENVPVFLMFSDHNTGGVDMTAPRYLVHKWIKDTEYQRSSVVILHHFPEVVRDYTNFLTFIQAGIKNESN